MTDKAAEFANRRKDVRERLRSAKHARDAISAEAHELYGAEIYRLEVELKRLDDDLAELGAK